MLNNLRKLDNRHCVNTVNLYRQKIHSRSVRQRKESRNFFFLPGFAIHIEEQLISARRA